jgi:superfamily I DNA/RNA helicase
VVETIADHLAGVFPAYRIPSGGDPEPPVDVDPADGPPLLRDVLPIFHEHERATREGPIERWMTFLHPDQYGLVCQRWNGPARIRGAAGTGKSVVALHRAAFLARRGGGPILFTTLVRNLPKVQKNLFARLEPSMRDRVEFLNLHAWARRMLARRGKAMSLDGGDGSFGRAWKNKADERRVLAKIEPRPTYWQEEINYVIKGRGILTVEEYQHVKRPGRRTGLQYQHREAVWELYREYEEIQSKHGKNDFADLILEALAELRRTPLERPYASVIVDEVQDLTLAAVQMLHALVGDAPDGLLLVGDDQQKVYPGGFKLVDAGISVVGRARVLRYNYRNGSAIFERARQFLADATYEDIDDAEPDREPVGTSDRRGEVIEVIHSSVAELERALVASINRLADDPAHRGAAAILCGTNSDVDRYCRLLTREGIRAEGLDSYDGQTSSAVKVGTYLRGKGIEFKHVFLSRYDEFLRDVEQGGAADQDWLALRRSQIYVAMTRARDTLWLGTVAPDQNR